MQDASRSKPSKKVSERIISLLKKSIILVFLDNLCCKIYSLLTSGFFARIFSGYSNKERSFEKAETFLPRWIRKIKEKLSEMIDRSPLVNWVDAYARRVLRYRLRVIGMFFLTFGVYTGIFSFITALFSDSSYDKYNSYFLSAQAIVLILISIPFMLSRMTVRSALSNSFLASRFIEILGFRLAGDDSGKEGSGNSILAFILGLAAGISSIIIEPLFIITGIAGLILVYMILSKPEFGAMLLFFLVPFAPTMALASLVILVAFAFFIKVIRSKRVFRFEKVDFFFSVFALMMLFGGFISLSSESIEPALIYVCFIAAYFLISCCIRSREWLLRCMTAAILSALVISFYGIIQYVFADALTMNSSWIDADMFGDIAGRAVATLENPNMLGEYLIIIIPMAASLWFSGEWMPRKNSFVSFACMCMCLILTWSRGAWLGFIIGFLILILIWNKRSLWLLLGGVMSLPLLTFILPSSIINRFASIGNLADSSTSYRVSIWRSAIHMARDNILSGIGVGKSAWDVAYSDYALPGIDVAGHSHNLYLQITVEIGILGLIIFTLGLFFMCQSGFSLFSRIKNAPPSIPYTDLSGSSPNSLAIRMSVAGPMCGVVSVLIQGLTDYSWYNYRVTLMFWLAIGLCVSMTKCGREFTQNSSTSAKLSGIGYDETKADTDIPIISS